MAERILSLIIILLGIFILYFSYGYPIESKMLPIGVGGMIIFLAIFPMMRPERIGSFHNLLLVGVYSLITLVSVYIMEKVGFFVSMAIFMPASFVAQQTRNLKLIIFASCSTLVALYFIFFYFFEIPLPSIFRRV
jgi:hypothetical protein